jgi:serine protease Do
MTLASAAEVDGAGETVVVVADVDPDGPAQKGIRTGDVILEVAGSCRPP